LQIASQLLQATVKQSLHGHRAHLKAAGHLSVAQALEHNVLNHLPLAGIQIRQESPHRLTLPFVQRHGIGSRGLIEFLFADLREGLGSVEQPLPHQHVPLLSVDPQQALQGLRGRLPTLLKQMAFQTHQPLLQLGLPPG
jgi:hypothetical protein